MEKNKTETSPAPAARPGSTHNPFGPGLPTIDVNEYGGKDGEGRPQVMNRRLFMQLLVFRIRPDVAVPKAMEQLTARLATSTSAVIYEDVNHVRGIGVLTWSEDPAHFTKTLRPLFADTSLGFLEPVPEFTMFGRTYSSGHEPRLEWWLLDKPRENVLSVESSWAIWYPLRRKGSFGRLEADQQASILREHAQIGFAYGQQNLAHDVRLACHGLDANDNDFVIGLIGHDLHPLSHVVQHMRKTRQTSEFIEHMGPFFVGHAVWRNVLAQ